MYPLNNSINENMGNQNENSFKESFKESVIENASPELLPDQFDSIPGTGTAIKYGLSMLKTSTDLNNNILEEKQAKGEAPKPSDFG